MKTEFTKQEMTHQSLIERKANKDEVKWFCENTENSIFTPPSPNQQLTK